MLRDFFEQFTHYFIEVTPWLLLGFFLSGLAHVFLPEKMVRKYLGGGGLKPIVMATALGCILPICCIGSLPVAVSMRKKGARLGAVLAFLVATPATSLSALVVSLALLGPKFTVFIFFAVIVMGVAMGILGDRMKFRGQAAPVKSCCGTSGCGPGGEGQATDPICGMKVSREGALHKIYDGLVFYFCCRGCMAHFESKPDQYVEHGERLPTAKEKALSALHYAFIQMPREMGLEILLGLALAALVVAVAPIGEFIGRRFSGYAAFPAGLGFGLVMYICSTASVPLVDALVTEGMNAGAGMTLLMAGPVTSVGTILVVRKQYGEKVLTLYLAVICAASLLLGLLYHFIA